MVTKHDTGIDSGMLKVATCASIACVASGTFPTFPSFMIGIGCVVLATFIPTANSEMIDEALYFQEYLTDSHTPHLTGEYSGQCID